MLRGDSEAVSTELDAVSILVESVASLRAGKAGRGSRDRGRRTVGAARAIQVVAGLSGAGSADVLVGRAVQTVGVSARFALPSERVGEGVSRTCGLAV